jgi:hypothetical protein
MAAASSISCQEVTAQAYLEGESIMENVRFKKLVDDIDDEVQNLLSGKFKNDGLLIFAADLLGKCKKNNYRISIDDSQKLKLLGAAALKAFDTFDYVPEARNFLNLTSTLSKELEQEG